MDKTLMSCVLIIYILSAIHTLSRGKMLISIEC